MPYDKSNMPSPPEREEIPIEEEFPAIPSMPFDEDGKDYEEDDEFDIDIDEDEIPF
jgi:hypothetical protein